MRLAYTSCRKDMAYPDTNTGTMRRREARAAARRLKDDESTVTHQTQLSLSLPPAPAGWSLVSNSLSNLRGARGQHLLRVLQRTLGHRRLGMRSWDVSNLRGGARGQRLARRMPLPSRRSAP